MTIVVLLLTLNKTMLAGIKLKHGNLTGTCLTELILTLCIRATPVANICLLFNTCLMHVYSLNILVSPHTLLILYLYSIFSRKVFEEFSLWFLSSTFCIWMCNPAVNSSKIYNRITKSYSILMTSLLDSYNTILFALFILFRVRGIKGIPPGFV